MLPVLNTIVPLVSKVLDFIPDPQKRAEAQLKLQQELNANSQAILEALSQIDKEQAKINIEEAKSSNLFISGWRPFIGWVCGLTFAWTYLLQPMITFMAAIIGHPIQELPTLNFSEIMPVLLGMLGLGGMRTWEKYKGVNHKH